MADGALRVFLSHTSELREYPSHVSYVAAAEEAVTNIGWVPVDMKYFPASDHVAAEDCIESVSGADVFIGIIGFRYGSLVSSEDAVSHTELEYRVASELKIPRLMFLLSEETENATGIPVKALFNLEEGLRGRQKEFRRRLKSASLCREFTDPHDLREKIFHALVNVRDSHRAASTSGASPVRVIGHPKELGRQRQLANQLRAAGCQIVDLRDDAPLVVCTTYRAVGSGWLDTVGDLIDATPETGLYVVEMDEGVVRPSFGRFMAGYWRDEQAVVDELVAGLRILSGDEIVGVGPVGADNEQLDFFDVATSVTELDGTALSTFRKDLRPDVRRRLPDALGTEQFLRQSSLMRDSGLTRAGVLLFGRIPAQLFPSALVQCISYLGTTKDSSHSDRMDIYGTVAQQIVEARRYVADHTQIGEAPSETGPTPETVYRYPMVAVREIIANAVAHRDYQDAKRCVHIRIFEDRLEIASPGPWEGHDLPKGEDQPLSLLAGESRKPNFRLASMLTWIRLLEGEGSGIPAAVRDCERSSAAGPTVGLRDGFIVVTLRPKPDRRDWTDEGRAWSLLDLVDVSRTQLSDQFRAGTRTEQLRVPIGVDSSGSPVELDINEAAQGGMGPHGLIIGATGSGKSELLRTLLLSLALSAPPESLNFALIDCKGGSTFAPLADLPHTSLVVSDLMSEPGLITRVAGAIAAELVRRQELLRKMGNYPSQREYERARGAGASLEALPTLLIVVDEFAELLAFKPDFIDILVQLGRLGRSLGVHLLLASQRLEEGRLRGLDTYLSYRIALRTFSGAESRAVMGTPDAATLPSAPGHGYLRVDSRTMVRFKAAYVSGPAELNPASDPGPSGSGPSGPSPSGSGPSGSGPFDPGPSDPGLSVLDAVVRRLSTLGPAARPI